MMARASFLAARIFALAVFGLTWAYGVVASSTFAFDMFVKPQLAPALTAFVNWHPVFMLAAYVLSAITLVPALRPARPSVRSHAAQALAIGYMLIIGATAFWMAQGAYLASIGGGQVRVLLMPGALLPVAWLALIDHLQDRSTAPQVRGPIDQRGLWMAVSSTAVLVWIAQAAWSWMVQTGGSQQVLAGSAWALLLDLALAQVAYVALALACTAGGVGWPAYVISLCFYAGAVALFAEYLVLPTHGLQSAACAAAAWPLGITTALATGGLRVSLGWTAADGVEALCGVRVERRRTAVAVAVIAVLTGTWGAAGFVQFDWAFVLRQAIAVIAAAVAMPFLRAALTAGDHRPWSVPVLAGPALVALVAVYGVPRLAAASGVTVLEPQRGIEHAVAADPLARVAAAALLSRQSEDTSVAQQLLDVPSSEWSLQPKAPANANPPITTIETPPNIFVIVLDSLRRDYLSPYNAAVSFTPAIDAWARESFVFRNAFTPYGGTSLAMPALWAGRAVPHGWARILPEINRLETLANSVPYDFALNDHTVREHLRPETHYTFLNPYTASPQTDLCQNVSALETHLRTRTSTAPVFAFLAPMNVHILNTRVGTGDESFPGFHAPYAAQLQRADGCFGQFIAYLKDSGLYDHSIVVLTSDHGDSLGDKTRGDEDKISPSMHRLEEEDPTIKYFRDPQTHELLLAGQGQLHIEVTVAKLKRRFGVDVLLKPPHIPYRETITAHVEAHGRHKKQTGGHGQFGDCKIKRDPLPRGSEFEFVDEIFGGSIPRQFIPAVEKGIQESRLRGYLAGYPVVDFRVTLFDGSYHDVDSNELSFKTAGWLAFKDAMSRARPTLLEPVMNVDIYAPSDHAGDLMGDLNGRRGRISGMESRGPMTVIKAQVPMAEMLTYEQHLTSATGGRGSYHMEYSHYDEVPNHLQAKIIATAKAERPQTVNDVT